MLYYVFAVEKKAVAVCQAELGPGKELECRGKYF